MKKIFELKNFSNRFNPVVLPGIFRLLNFNCGIIAGVRAKGMRVFLVFFLFVFIFQSFELFSWPFRKKTKESVQTEESGEVPDLKNQTEKKAEIRKGKPVNSVRYIVGDIAITEHDIDDMGLLLKKKARTGGAVNRKPIDELIIRAIVEIESRASSIIVSDAKVNNEIKKRMESSGITNEATFQNLVSRETGLPYQLWMEDLRYQIKRHQLIQIAIPIPQPDDSELRRHYNKKKHQIGLEILYREIVFRPKNTTSAEELRVSNLARKVRADLMRNPGSFPKVARTHSENVSFAKGRGGLVGYLAINEIAETDRILASQLFNLRPGQISSVFRDQGNRYIVVRLEGKRPLPFEKAKSLIQQDIYMNNIEKNFDQWVEKRKKETAIVEVK
ncbi:MAG: peptidylprolyl isomerase [Spirochaetia bacterium]|nr:peptidylprolyl isomerase [Spirochaetia bacterium]